MMIHYTDNALLNPVKKITVALVGLGGTGSQMLGNLARIDATLLALGHPGLHIYAFDHDTVSESNIGRQLFSPADLGLNKAIVLVSRLNRFFGLNWEAFPEKYCLQVHANITITCTDTIESRVTIDTLLQASKHIGRNEPHERFKYWLDIGNSQKTGQVVLGTIGKIDQPKKAKRKGNPILKNVIHLFPEIKAMNEKDQGPSCSLAEAIRKQDLFINPMMAILGANMIWKLFREGVIDHQGCFVNLETMQVNPIKIS